MEGKKCQSALVLKIALLSPRSVCDGVVYTVTRFHDDLLLSVKYFPLPLLAWQEISCSLKVKKFSFSSFEICGINKSLTDKKTPTNQPRKQNPLAGIRPLVGDVRAVFVNCVGFSPVFLCCLTHRQTSYAVGLDPPYRGVL